MSSFAVVDVALGSGEMAKGLIDSREARQTPIVVDFLSPKLKHRLKNGADGEAIVKALGVKRSDRAGLLIYDFTAGLGTEAFLLARAGFAVVAFERDPLVFQLLEDGLRRWRQAENTTVEERDTSRPRLALEFRYGDAVSLVREGLRDQSLKRAYAVTLDPMFEGEATEGKSRPKKEMATLRKMLSTEAHAKTHARAHENDLRDLFFAALSVAEARVVVKRPDGAPDIASIDASGRALKPVRRLEGKTARFDIYSCR